MSSGRRPFSDRFCKWSTLSPKGSKTIQECLLFGPEWMNLSIILTMYRYPGCFVSAEFKWWRISASSGWPGPEIESPRRIFSAIYRWRLVISSPSPWRNVHTRYPYIAILLSILQTQVFELLRIFRPWRYHPVVRDDNSCSSTRELALR
jgi:hypothetical protein